MTQEKSSAIGRHRRVRRWRLLAVTAVVALAATACPADEPQDVDEPLGEPQHGGEIVVGIEDETNSWLPGEGTFAAPGNAVLRTFYDTFMVRLPDGEIVPYLAESVEPNEDLDEWTVTLREGVQFHDGTDLTAEVVVANFNEYLVADGSNLLGTLRDVEEVVATDEHTVVYRLHQANAAFDDLFTGVVGAPFSIEAAREAGEDAGSNPVGTGPFEFESWSRDDRLVVERNDNYWRDDLPYLDRITFRPIPDEESRVQSLIAGDIDVMQTLRQSTVVTARQNEGQIRLHEFQGNNSGGSIFNTMQPPVDDDRVRRALAWAIDQESLVEILGGVEVTPVRSQYFTSESDWFSDEVDEAWPNNDTERAQELIDEYVNDPNRSDGQEPGSPVSVEYDCPPDPSLIELSQAYQAFWSEVGVEVSLNQVDQATHIQQALEADYMIKCWRISGEADPYILWRDSYGDPEVNPLNFTNYTDPVIDENLEILRTETDFDARYEAVEAISMHFTESVPFLLTGSTPVLFGTGMNVGGVDGWTTPDGHEGGVAGIGDGGTTFFTETWVE